MERNIELVFTEEVYNDFVEYLNSHEQDIAVNINDYGELFNLFVQVLGREPGVE